MRIHYICISWKSRSHLFHIFNVRNYPTNVIRIINQTVNVNLAKKENILCKPYLHGPIINNMYCIHALTGNEAQQRNRFL